MKFISTRANPNIQEALKITDFMRNYLEGRTPRDIAAVNPRAMILIYLRDIKKKTVQILQSYVVRRQHSRQCLVSEG